jgi:hypothetical protein
MMELLTIIDRKNEVRQLPAPAQYVKQRIAQAAQELSKAGDMALHVELANESLCNFVVMLYQWDQDGVWPNIDNVTHRLRVPAPWGSLGWKKWGLRKWEALILRRILMGRVGKARHTPLFDYNSDTRTWHLNLTNYATLDRANAYLKHCSVSLAEWRYVSQQIDQRVSR